VADPKTYTQEEVDAILAEKDALKANRDEALTEAKKAKAALRNYDGVDPAEYQRLKQASEDAERKRAAAEGDFKALEKQLVERHTAELAQRDTKLTKAMKALEQRAIRSELQAALVKAGAFPDELDLLVERGERYARMKETDDGFEAFIADERGNPLVADGKGTPMDFGTFVEQKLKATYPRLFQGSGSSGGGATKSAAGGSGGSPQTIVAGDARAWNDHLEAIAKGEINVQS
jgi:hypothetical protein